MARKTVTVSGVEMTVTRGTASAKRGTRRGKVIDDGRRTGPSQQQKRRFTEHGPTRGDCVWLRLTWSPWHCAGHVVGALECQVLFVIITAAAATGTVTKPLCLPPRAVVSAERGDARGTRHWLGETEPRVTTW